MNYLFPIGIFVLLCCTVVWPQTPTVTHTQEVAGISRNIGIQCSIPQYGANFWLINGSVYGLLQVPSDIRVCTDRECNLDSLAIPVVTSEMNGYTFQCFSIDHQDHALLYLGDITLLTVVTLPMTGSFSNNGSIQNDTLRDNLELSYPQSSVGAVNTTIGWTYNSLTCHPSVFTIQGYADRDAIQQDTPTLTLTSSSSVLAFPTNITNGSLYWRLQAHEEAGTPCAQDSALRYYHLDTNDTTPIPITPSSDGIGCVPIPVGPSPDYSSLEVVWPERRDTVGRLCYCPPFEGEQHLFSRCISTTSCDTDYSITVSNGSVCFAGLSPPLTSIPVYFTLLESCPHDEIRPTETTNFPNASANSMIPTKDVSYEPSTVATRNASNNTPTRNLPTGYLPTRKFPTGNLPTGNLPTGNLRTRNLPTGNLQTGNLPARNLQTGSLLHLAIFMVAVIALLLLSFPILIISYCCISSWKTTQSSIVRQLARRRVDDVQTERIYELVFNEATVTVRETPTEATYSVIERSANGEYENGRVNMTSHSTLSDTQLSPTVTHDSHRMHRTLDSDTASTPGDKLVRAMDNSGSAVSGDTKGPLYSSLDHAKSPSGHNTSEKDTTHNTLHIGNSNGKTDAHFLPLGVYATLDRPQGAPEPSPGAVYSAVSKLEYCMVNRTDAVEGVSRTVTAPPLDTGHESSPQQTIAMPP